MQTIGVDLSLTATGVVVLRFEAAPGARPTVVLAKTLRPGARRGAERLAWHQRELTHVLRLAGAYDGLTVVATEGYAYGARVGREAAGELGGVLRLLCHHRSISLGIVPPTVLKKFVTGRGDSDKAVLMRDVWRRWGFESNDHNVCDAYALARFARAASENRTKVFASLLKKSTWQGPPPPFGS